MAHTSLVSQLVGPVSVPTGSSSNEPESLARPLGGDASLIVNQTVQLAAWHVSSDPCARKEFVRTLPNSSWQLGGLAQTQFVTPPGKNGIAGVSGWKLIHFAPTLADITSFLAHLFEDGLEYRTINTYRSALWGVLPPIDGFPVGQHPLVIRLLRGVLDLRQALLRYQQSWSVDVVLIYLRSLPRNEDLSLKLLTQKLAI